MTTPDHIVAINTIQSKFDEYERKIKCLVEQNELLMRAAASVKVKLEKTLKQPTTLNNAVYEAIDLLRPVTPYTKDSGVSHSIDPPLTDEEKTLG